MKGMYTEADAPAGIPIHTVPNTHDYVLRGYDHCRRYHEHINSVFTSSELAEELREDGELFSRLSDATGVAVSASNIKPVADNVLILKQLAKQSGAGAGAGKSTIADLSAPAMKRVETLRDLVNYRAKSSRVMGRLMVGNLLREILEHMAQMLQDFHNPQGNQETARFTLYSGHDTTLMGILAALGSNLGRKMPSFGSHIEFELLELLDSRGSGSASGGKKQDAAATMPAFDVRVKYNDRAVPLGSCPIECPIAQAATYISAAVPSTIALWSAECSNTAHEINGAEFGTQYLGLDWDEWSTMAFLLSALLALENVLFDYIVCRRQASERGRRGNKWDRSAGDVQESSPCVEGRRRTICCGVVSCLAVGMTLAFLIAYGVDWNEWPTLCFVIVTLISLEAIAMVSVTLYHRLFKQLDNGYDLVATDDYDENDPDAGFADTL